MKLEEIRRRIEGIVTEGNTEMLGQGLIRI
jgi:hypothetical protein